MKSLHPQKTFKTYHMLHLPENLKVALHNSLEKRHFILINHTTTTSLYLAIAISMLEKVY
ncbi:CLUMA_CG003363, isoform A [Clunio marinus]|uniref:CLUMA_CG003363, isoform A n=1 Tax=Clunio marinus TaxID=568069 RepID=A0A1J1HNB8_9DIPT|nr:CLUMA_CG003363, isoform A [Clunio marinus]